MLVIFMIGFKVNGFIALVLVAAVVGFAEGMGAQDVLHFPYKSGIGGTLGGLARSSVFTARCWGNFRYRRRAARFARRRSYTFGKTLALGAGDHAGLIVGGNVFEVRIQSTAVAARFYDCSLIGAAIAVCPSGFQWSPPYPLRTASCRRIRPTAIATIFEANLGRPCCMG